MKARGAFVLDTVPKGDDRGAEFTVRDARMAFVKLLLRHRGVTAVALLLSLVVSAWSARRIQTRFQFQDFYDYPSNPRLPLLNRYLAEFGDPAAAVVVLVESSDVFQPVTMRYLDAVTRDLQTRSDYSTVRSLTNVPVARAAGDGVDTGPLTTKVPETSEEVERIRSTALGSALLVERLVSRDGTMTAVVAKLRRPVEDLREQSAAIETARDAVARQPGLAGIRARVTGAPSIEVGTTKALVRDILTLTPCATLVMIAGLALTFRSIQGVVLPLAAVFVSLVWTTGIFATFGRPIDLVASVFPTTLIVYGVVDPIFVFTRYAGKLALGRSREQAVVEALSELLLPCFLTSMTTALGFAVFVTATLPTIRSFGLIVAIGVALAFVTTVTVLPLLLVSVPPPTPGAASSPLVRKLDQLFARLWEWTRRRRSVILATVAAFFVFGAAVGSKIRIASTYVGSLPSGPELQAVRDMEDKLSGVVRLLVLLEGPPGSMKTPEALRAMDAVERLARRDPIVTSSTSLADLVSELNRAFEGGAAQERRIPDSPVLVAQYLSLVDPADKTDFVTGDYASASIASLLRDRGSPSVWKLRDEIQTEADRVFAPLGIQARITGAVVAYQELDEMVREVLWGFVFAFGIIVLLEWVLFRSLRVALISVVPNLVPVTACFLVMRWMGFNLRVESSLVLCVSIGGLFNTTIHIIARVLQQRRAGAGDPDTIVERALRAVGPPSLYTAANLSAGFLVVCISRFEGLQAMGLLSAVTLSTAFVADAFVTPSLLRWLLDWGPTVARSEMSTAESS